MSSDYQVFLKTLSEGRIATTLMALALGLSTIMLLSSEGKLNYLEITMATLGTLAGAAFIKVTVLFCLFPFLKRTKFSGSFLTMALLTGLLFLLALLSLLFVASRHFEHFPVPQLPLILLAGYLVASMFVFVVFRLSHRVFRSN